MGIIISIIGFYVVVVIVFIIQFYLAKRDITNNIPKYIDARKPPQGCYQPIRDTCGKYPQGFKIPESIMIHEKSLIILGQKVNEGMSTSKCISMSGYEIEIKQDMMCKNISIIIGNDKPLFLNKQQVDELIKFIS